MQKINDINFRVTPNETHIAISYKNETGRPIILIPKYNDVYTFAAANNHLNWYEDKLVNGEVVTTYQSITLYELLNDSQLSERLLYDYLNTKFKKPTYKSAD